MNQVTKIINSGDFTPPDDLVFPLADKLFIHKDYISYDVAYKQAEEATKRKIQIVYPKIKEHWDNHEIELSLANVFNDCIGRRFFNA